MGTHQEWQWGKTRGRFGDDIRFTRTVDNRNARPANYLCRRFSSAVSGCVAGACRGGIYCRSPDRGNLVRWGGDGVAVIRPAESVSQSAASCTSGRRRRFY